MRFEAIMSELIGDIKAYGIGSITDLKLFNTDKFVCMRWYNEDTEEITELEIDELPLSKYSGVKDE